MKISRVRDAVIFCFLSCFFILYWLPFILYALSGDGFPFLSWIHAHVNDLWVGECDLVFFGHHYPIGYIGEPRDTRLNFQALFASIILSLLVTCIALWIDHYRPFISHLKEKIFPYLYSFTAKLIAILMIGAGLGKVFPDQFHDINLPSNMMSNVGSLNSWQVFWMAYGSNEFYERALGLAELLGAILLWMPRLAILGSVILTIVLVNILLMDFFCEFHLNIFVSLLLGGCLVILWPEMKHYANYFLRGKTETRTAPVYSLAREVDSSFMRKLFHVVSVLFCLGTIIYSINLHIPIYRQYKELWDQPLYGVWDSTAKGIYVGNYSLQSIGILSDGDDSDISVYNFNSLGVPDDIPGKTTRDSVSFTLQDEHNTSIVITGQLENANNLILHYREAGKVKTVHYNRRYIEPRSFPPRMVFQDTDPL